MAEHLLRIMRDGDLIAEVSIEPGESIVKTEHHDHDPAKLAAFNDPFNPEREPDEQELALMSPVTVVTIGEAPAKRSHTRKSTAKK